MGIVQDIHEIFHTVIEKSHQGDRSVPAVNEMYYTAGWSVNTNQTMIEHPGGNPAFGTEVVILLNEQTAICLLTNGANINRNMVLKVKDILDGNLTQSYGISGTQLLGIFLSSTTIILCLLAVLFFLLGLLRRKEVPGTPYFSPLLVVGFSLTRLSAESPKLALQCCFQNGYRALQHRIIMVGAVNFIRMQEKKLATVEYRRQHSFTNIQACRGDGSA